MSADPVSLFIISATLAGATTVMEYRSAKAENKATEDAYRYNAKLAEAQGRAAEDAAAENARRQLVEERRKRAAARALYGASGVALDSGSPLANLAQSAADAEGNALSILLQGHHAMSSALTTAAMQNAQADAAARNSPRKWQYWTKWGIETGVNFAMGGFGGTAGKIGGDGFKPFQASTNPAPGSTAIPMPKKAPGA